MDSFVPGATLPCRIRLIGLATWLRWREFESQSFCRDNQNMTETPIACVVEPTARQTLGHRWGSCSEKGTLKFHWKAVAGPVEALYYVVVHELAHLVNRDLLQSFGGSLSESFLGGSGISSGWPSTALI